MDYSKKQKQLDVKKWIDSETKNYDTCGEYKFCSCCNKGALYPCAYAYEKHSLTAKIEKEANGTTITKKATSKKTTTSKKTKKEPVEVC